MKLVIESAIFATIPFYTYFLVIGSYFQGGGWISSDFCKNAGRPFKRRKNHVAFVVNHNVSFVHVLLFHN